MAYKTVNGKLVKTSGNKFAKRNIIFQGETDWSIINWTPKLRDAARKQFDSFVKYHGFTEQEAIGTLVSAIGEMLAADRQDDLTKDFVLLSSMAMYAAVCATPNESSTLTQEHNYAAVVILQAENGFRARWVGSFKARDDNQALGRTWNSLIHVARPTFNTDRDYAGHSPAYDRAVKMLAVA
jgi:hypothetical protein